MTINIADNLKRLRKRREITQEELANFVGVSFQAVSKWERGEGYPDITILPVIANFFEVSIDELMGMNEINNQNRLEAVFSAVQKNYSNGSLSENITLIREELKSFPTNYQLLYELALSLSIIQDNPENERKNKEEAIDILQKIMEYSTDTEIRNNAQGDLCFYYKQIGENEKAIEQAIKLPSAWKSREAILPSMLNDSDFIKSCQQSIITFMDALRLQLRDLADANYTRSLPWTVEERITIIGKCIKIYDVIFDDKDYLYYNIYLSESYRTMAALSLLDDNKEEALTYMGKAVEHSILYDSLPDKEKYTSLLINQLEHNIINTTKNFYHNWSFQMLNEYLIQERYDCIRADERFIGFVNKLKKVAK
ncbi:MAG: helix-turn-helix domain-containing protein [Eubacteriales bacterium]